MSIRIKGYPHPYEVRDRECIGRSCLNLHPIQVRGATASGSRFTGRYRHACGRRDHHGCPNPTPDFDPELAKGRRREGMRNA